MEEEIRKVKEDIKKVKVRIAEKESQIKNTKKRIDDIDNAIRSFGYTDDYANNYNNKLTNVVKNIDGAIVINSSYFDTACIESKSEKGTNADLKLMSAIADLKNEKKYVEDKISKSKNELTSLKNSLDSLRRKERQLLWS